MGRSKRIQPEKLKIKLGIIRDKMGFTLQEMSDSLKKHAQNEFIDPSYVSQFEKGKREPSLRILLAYSTISGVSINILVDDERNLPKHIPTYGWIFEAARLPSKD